MNQSNRGQASVVYYISLKNDHMKNIKTHAKEYLIVKPKGAKVPKGKTRCISSRGRNIITQESSPSFTSTQISKSLA